MGRILPFSSLGFLYLGLLVASIPTKQRLVRPSGGATGLKIAAFNARTFGETKMSKEEVVDILVQIVRRYDIILIQGIRDITQESIYELLSLVNKEAGGTSYSMELSERLGRSIYYKEQYAFLYRNESAAALGSYQYDDGPDDGSDAFEREPFFVKFRSLISEI
ncbi:deoxyribonuclease-1-like [Lingula anatina]|uniref:Deoxyribonuclease-1-like n=1 Tax=Lingula anatina TaxID=7574 RepID=A0A2R2MU14_LINAN|nr:deoxyribonuclease-1-like [Lingula anatina]|eukprot:XP_023933542.1 deoxyribonuclease-1-like [Lingula anatina]